MCFVKLGNFTLQTAYTSYIIILDPDDDDRAYVCNITPWLTPHSN